MAIDPNWVHENPEEAARKMDVLSEERDQYRAAEEMQIALRKKGQARIEELKELCTVASDEIIKAGQRFLELDRCIEFLNKQNAEQQEQYDLLAAHIMAVKGLVVGHRMRGMFGTSGPAFSRLMLEWYETAPTVSLARHDLLKQADALGALAERKDKEAESEDDAGLKNKCAYAAVCAANESNKLRRQAEGGISE